MPKAEYSHFRIYILTFSYFEVGANVMDEASGISPPMIQTVDVSVGPCELNDAMNDILADARRSLESQVPLVQESRIPNEENTADKTKNIIKQANNQTLESILGFISKSEDARIKRQNPVLYVVLVLTLLQLIVFNGLIAFVIYSAVKTPTAGNLPIILEFLKYYIGAVLVEMIGMIVFITKSTFTSSTKEMLNIVKAFPSKDKS